MLTRPLLIIAFFLIFNDSICLSQSARDTIGIELLKRYTSQSPRQVFGKGPTIVPSTFLLVPNLAAMTNLAKHSVPGYISFQLPVSGTSSLPVLIKESSVLAKGFKVTTSSNKKVDLPAVKFYTGKLAGDNASSVSLMISEDGIEGLIYGQTYSYTVGKVRGSNSKNLHMVYQTHELPEKVKPECTIIEASVTSAVKSSGYNATARVTDDGCRRVGIYLEADYDLYQTWGTDMAYITNQITALFNNVATLYANEGVPIELSELKIWDKPDPYVSSTNRGEMLEQFKNYWNGQGNTFNGDIAHLLSSRIDGGGIAFVFVRGRSNANSIDDIASVFFKSASRELAFGVSTGIGNFPLPPLPEYSYRTYLIAHELGHNFGLPHTHSCLWHGGPLDNCATQEGTCSPSPGPRPTNGGTIMSYCANLANGFGPQPSAKLKYEFITAQNLMHPGGDPPGISSSQNTAMKGANVEISISNCSGSVIWDDGVVTGHNRIVTPKAPTEYSALCINNGCLSASVQAFINTICVQPSACSISYSTDLSNIHGISEFRLGAIATNDFYGAPENLRTSYEDFTCTQHAILNAGETYPFGLNGTYGNDQYARIYIDYNGDGNFSDTDELVYSGNSASQHNGNVSIPNSALRHTPLRMRVLMNPLPLNSAFELPSNQMYRSGKANDYSVTITAPTCPPGLRETVQSGEWNDPLVWSCGTLPDVSDFVKINPGHFISLPTAYTGQASDIELIGTIQYGTDATLQLNQH